MENVAKVENNTVKIDTAITVLLALLTVYSGLYSNLESFSFTIVVFVLLNQNYLTHTYKRVTEVCLGIILLTTCIVLFKEFYPEFWMKTFDPKAYETHLLIQDMKNMVIEYAKNKVQ